MKKTTLLSCLVPFFIQSNLRAVSYDIVEFYREEATVSSASRQPQKIREVPATVYVVSGEDIKSSGAQTIWDALRAVPGVDVMTLRTFHGEVGIRGLNRSLNNRVLVLLDGKTVLNGFFDYVNWESIPVTLEEIDRIEVVEGPVSAVHGANAISGAINIITKTPEQISGGVASYWGGERDTHFASGLYGRQNAKFGYKLGLGWRTGNKFEDSDQLSSEVSKIHGSVNVAPTKDSQLAFTGGAANHNTQLNTATGAFDDGVTSFARVDYKFKETSVRGYWNRARTILRDHTLDPRLDLDYDTYDVDLEQAVSLPYKNSLVAGFSYRRNTAATKIFNPSPQSQDLWAFYFEDMWRPLRTLTFSFSGRLDKHPLTRAVFSPRGSIIYNPVPNQTVRFSAGTAFRSPTLLENYVNLSVVTPNLGSAALPNPPFTATESLIVGNEGVNPESLFFQEIYYGCKIGPVQTTAAGFHYVLSDIVSGIIQTVSSVPPVLKTQTMIINQGRTEAWGGELGAVWEVNKNASTFANYSYQSLMDDPQFLALAPSAPRHKVNAGGRVRAKGVTASLWMDWVDETSWSRGTSGSTVLFGSVDDYILLNGRVGYEFTGRLKGLEVAVTAFNLANNEHFEILPPVSRLAPAQNGEIVRSRWMGTISYRF